MKSKLIEGILKKAGHPDLIELMVQRLSFSELQSLLLKIFELKVSTKSSVDILKDYQSNRFVQPSDIDPNLRRRLDLLIFSLLPLGFELIDLSPLTPLGTSGVLTPVHQNNVVSTIRNMEVAADTTNVLALECALRRKEICKKEMKSRERVKLCSSQRVTRGQPFEGKNFSAHFCVIALCSAGKDEGNDKFEAECLTEHVNFYIKIIDQLILKKEIRNIVIKFFEYEGFDNCYIIKTIKSQVASRKDVHIKTEKNSEFGKGYYSRLRFAISVINQNQEEFDYIDGGFTDWTSKLLNNKKERLLTSGIGTDYLLRTIKIINLQ
ncbi:MAG: hypothetical protein WA816_11540 [Bacteroidales bacterium]